MQKRTANQPPAWKSTSWELDAAYVQESYSSSILDLAFDPDGDPLVFSITEGPDWLKVNGNGTLEGVPAASDLGIHSVFFSVEDSKGDSQTLHIPYTIKVRPDTNPPVKPATPQISSALDPKATPSADLTNNPSPVFKGLAETSSTVDVFLDGDRIGSSVPMNQVHGVLHPSPCKHQLTVRAIDRAGNRSVESAPLSFTVDTRSPRITSPKSATTLDENSGENQVVYVATSDDQLPVSYSIDDAHHFSIDPDSGVVRFRMNPDFEDSGLPTSFRLDAKDSAGNSSSKRIDFKVKNVDDDSPRFTSGGKAKRLDEHSGEGQVIYRARHDPSGVRYDLVKSLDFDNQDFEIDNLTGEVSLGLIRRDEISILLRCFAIDDLGNEAVRRVQYRLKMSTSPSP